MCVENQSHSATGIYVSKVMAFFITDHFKKHHISPTFNVTSKQIASFDVKLNFLDNKRRILHTLTLSINVKNHTITMWPEFAINFKLIPKPILNLDFRL